MMPAANAAKANLPATGQSLRRLFGRLDVRILLLVANFINIGADLGATGTALRLLIEGPQTLYAIAFGLFRANLEIVVNYRRYISILKWLTLSRGRGAGREGALGGRPARRTHSAASICFSGGLARRSRSCTVGIFKD
jgi:hypothetical protein